MLPGSSDGTATTGEAAAAGESARVMSANESAGPGPGGPVATERPTGPPAGAAADAGAAVVVRFTTDSYIFSISGTTASTLYISLIRSSAALPSGRWAAGSRST